MSLRRSARIASSNTLVNSEPKAENGVAKYEKVAKPTATTKKRKTKVNLLPAEGTDETESTPPATPLPKKKYKSGATVESPLKPPPFTPTPSAINLLSTSTSLRQPETDHPLETLLQPRPAAPHATNAPLSTPNGSYTVSAYPTSSPIKPEDPSPAKKRKAKELVPPDVGAIPNASTDVERLLKDAEEFLVKVDPKLEELVKKHHCKIFSPEGLREVVDPFTALSSGIIGQQVSGQAASSIRAKFTALFPTTHPAFPTPTQVLQLPIPTLRTAGLSQRKAEYITGLAEKFCSGELTAQMLVSASDEELIEKLVAVRGLGRWSVEMFACFGLKRMDVFSTGDLGVQRGMAVYAGRDVNKLKSKGGKWKYMTEREMLDTAANFSPYRCVRASISEPTHGYTTPN
ncbi:DNA-3-methyladenine glycosylase [Pyrenophora tritici-repentis]|nr:DNA-3-methyladenine glycosylase [Pyrenophora tritici-repentis]KAI0625067.1 DNA-3-methyladenine glycosylase [Pyrenophora tritici-repentis]KAI1543069.1 AlkA 3-methyladenine DNA glycosylase 8-oxoguanine DNA glycosylase [Pyrenophora tritici-repentis]KAI1579147.1 AlkA 3-methyladenine DNA glycosylase 8-oxoguanine DNA glycosylase [Pyrenophora tritici-repentis]